ncbi:nucleotidyltransferase, putative [Citrifermentans bemidjiense Bem]|uniref:Nucleotidyltransferase, putative n=1 Tax=Citrifermentans bemidjiense (strain ATCC BAA-1014 / DSM 16622 / JCM 12645 / Bem) TaxID=404380 RepID=B5EDU6_CITBB|nr:NTP transferase domain-containing protein [Citrifermentans bemidjiense]ACH40724.1 nucleotidyltransferase, putative [Citrifermentans bemidjiense Bem]
MVFIGVIEARMGSSRLPGKTLTAITGEKSLLECVVKRFRLAKNVNDVWVATTVEAADDAIAAWCAANGVPCHRGSEMDVLDRVTGAVCRAGADYLVQMGADSAYLDFQLIDHMVEIARNGAHDYVCNDLELTWPLGIYGHVVKVEKLVQLNTREDLTTEDREDVVRFIWEHPEQYDIRHLTAPPEFAHPYLRFTIDYPEDLQLAREIYQILGTWSFTTRELIRLSQEFPELFLKTKGLVQRSAPFMKTHA